ncbi:MAG: hypothetical protein V4614_13700 [Pseudomonadota bacterium]
MSIRKILNEYRTDIGDARVLITKLAAVPTLVAKEQDFLYNAVFLKTFVAWEKFLEATMVAYLLSKRGVNGGRAAKYSRPRDEQHATKMLIGTQKYVDWANQEIVIRLAKIYLVDGEPFASAFAGIHTDLIDLKTIRNSIAHISTTTSQPLDALASRLLTQTIVAAKPSQILLALTAGTAQTHFDRYLALLDSAAEVICNP